MAINPPGCTPEDLEKLAKLAADDNYGKLNIDYIDIRERPPETAEEFARVSKFGSFLPLRTMRGIFGNEFSAGAHNELIMATTKGQNALSALASKQKEAFLDAADDTFFTGGLKRFYGIGKDLDVELQSAIQDSSALVTDRAKKAAPKIRAWLDDVYNTHVKGDENLIKDIPSPREYIDYLRLRNEAPEGRGVFWFNAEPTENEAVFMAALNKEKISWFTDMERTGGLLNPERRLSFDMNTYATNVVKSKFLKPEIARIEKEVIAPMFGVKKIKNGPHEYISTLDDVGLKTWLEYKNYLEGGPTAMDYRLAGVMKKIFKNMGWEGKTDVRSLYAFSSGTSNLVYSSLLGSPIGGRPASIIRQFGQLIPSYAELGTRHMLVGMKSAIDDFTTGGAQAARFAEMGVFTSHIENLVHAADLRGITGRGLSSLADTTLRMFSWTDRQVRLATALGSESKFNEAIAKGGIEQLKARPEIKEELIRRVRMGQLDNARSLYVMDNLANLQYVYGKVNRAEWQRGAIGNLVGMLTSYPLNTFEMFKMMAERSGHWEGKAFRSKFVKDDPMPLFRLIGLSMLATYAGSEMLGADIRSMMFFSAMPHSLTLPKAVADGINFGTTSMEYLTGKMFGIGESSYAKKERNEAYNEAARALTMFIPGYQAVNDLTKVINEGQLARMFALTPKAEELDRLNKQRIRDRRAEEAAANSSFTSGLTLKGL